jgi:hypothetical protein
MEGGFFLRKKPLSIPVSVKSRSENAVTPGCYAWAVASLARLTFARIGMDEQKLR